MTLTLTPEPSTGPMDPPRVKAEAVAPDGGTFTQLTLRRDGVETRRAPFVGANESEVYDYEAPFGQSLSYQLTGFYLPVTAPDWTESWASVAAWTGSGFSASGGKAVSSTNGAQIVRSASGTIQRVAVTDPDYVRVELLTAGDVVVVSVAVAANVTLTGTSATSATGGGSFELTLSDGTATASASDSSWSLSRPFTGLPEKVRIVSLYVPYVTGITWGTTGLPFGISHDTTYAYVADTTNNRLRKFNKATGTETLSGGFPINTTGRPAGVAVNSGYAFVGDFDNNRIRKFDLSTGAEVLTGGFPITTVSPPHDVAFGTVSTAIYVTDFNNSRLRKFNTTTGAEVVTGGFPINTTGQPSAVALDGSDNVYVTTGTTVRKFSSAGVAGITFSTTGDCNGIALDSAGRIFTTDFTTNVLRIFSAAGSPVTSLSVVGAPSGLTIDSADAVYVTDGSNNRVRKFVAKVNATVGDITTTLVTTEQPYSSSATTQLDETRAWLIHPSQPSLSVAIDENQWSDTGSNVSLESAQETVHELPTSTFSPPGRTRSVSYPLGPRRAGLWTLVLQMGNLSTRDTLLALLADGAPLLLRSPDAYDWDLPDDWYAVGEVRQGRIVPALQQKYRTLTLPLTPSESPPVALVPEFTFGDLLLVAPTFQDVLDNYDTFLDVLTGNAS